MHSITERPFPQPCTSYAMSYAAVTASNAPPPSQQPHANPNLLNTGSGPHQSYPVDAYNEKVNIASPGFKDHPSVSCLPVISVV